MGSTGKAQCSAILGAGYITLSGCASVYKILLHRVKLVFQSSRWGIALKIEHDLSLGIPEMKIAVKIRSDPLVQTFQSL